MKILLREGKDKLGKIYMCKTTYDIGSVSGIHRVLKLNIKEAQSIYKWTIDISLRERTHRSPRGA